MQASFSLTGEDPLFRFERLLGVLKGNRLSRFKIVLANS
jgi:hypothetical protein